MLPTATLSDIWQPFESVTVAVTSYVFPPTSTLEGLTVKTQGGRFLGAVTEILQTGSNDVFVVKGQKEYLIPFINDVVIDINLEAETITISLLEGLIDDL